MAIPDEGAEAEAVEALGEMDLFDWDAEPVAAEPAANAAADAEGVKIDKANFPAKAFRDYVKEHYDADGDGMLSEDEASAVTEIHLRTREQREDDVGKLTCATLKGIEHFPNLQVLDAVECGLTELDVSKNTKLVRMECQANKLKKLDVRKN